MLSATTIVGADLSGLSLLDETLSAVDLTGTTLIDVDFRRTDLGGTIGFETATRGGVSWYDAATIFPFGFDPAAAGLFAYGSPGVHATIVTSDDVIPGSGGLAGNPFGLIGFGLYGAGLALNDVGEVAFEHAISHQLSSGIYRGDGGPVTSLVWYGPGSVAPGAGGSLDPLGGAGQHLAISTAVRRFRKACTVWA